MPPTATSDRVCAALTDSDDTEDTDTEDTDTDDTDTDDMDTDDMDTEASIIDSATETDGVDTSAPGPGNLGTVVQVSAGSSYTCAVNDRGADRCWGSVWR